MKKYYRCIVCGDLHFGNNAPELCPTCFKKNVYVEIEKSEFNNIASSEEATWDFNEIKNHFTELAKSNGEFILNPDKEHTDMILNGLLEKQKKDGLKLCPCRIGDGTRKRELDLVCPCNFFNHDVYIEKKRDTKQCWCGLFVKK